jgi:molybdate transport system ATP-binding protein
MIRLTLRKSLMGSEGSIDLLFDLSIAEQALVAIMGPSGAGKTSVLKMIAGLMRPETGEIMIGDACWYSSQQKISRTPQERSIGFVFQDYALFPNMSVRQNLEYALEDKHQRSMITEVLQLMDMEKLQHQRPKSLSGGQQQRIALARAIVRRPRLLLLDEPFAALDREMREKLQQDLLRLHRHYGTTTLLISHDAGEVARMADEVIYLSQGKIIREGKPAEVLPVMETGKISGEVVSIDEQAQSFVLYSPLNRSLWRFILPPGLKMHKGQSLEVSYQQGAIRVCNKSEE